MNGGPESLGKRRRQLAAIVIVLLGVVGVAIWLLRPLASPTARNETKPAAIAADVKDSGDAGASTAATDAAETSASRTPTAATITPEEFAKAWQARALKTIRNKNERLLGEEVANLLTMPRGEAWRELTERAHNGDANAATAAMQLANDCQVLRNWNSITQDWGRAALFLLQGFAIRVAAALAQHQYHAVRPACGARCQLRRPQR